VPAPAAAAPPPNPAFQPQVRHAAPPPQASGHARPAYSRFTTQDLDRLYAEYDDALKDDEPQAPEVHHRREIQRFPVSDVAPAYAVTPAYAAAPAYTAPPAYSQYNSRDLDQLYSQYDQALHEDEVGNGRAPFPRNDFSAPGLDWRTPFADELDLEIDSPNVAVIPAWARANP